MADAGALLATPAVDHSATRSSPYKGLQPYTEADRAYFFGRERDREILISNLYAAPLTVLYGASGVGKSSVLLAGVVPELVRTRRVAVVMFRAWQDPEFADALKNAIFNAVRRSAGRELDAERNARLDDLLLDAARIVRGPVFLILDQFEEYFMYHGGTAAAELFDSDLARAVNRRDVDAHFMVSLRDDGLGKLDRLRGRIPNLMSNLLRLEHLDRGAACDAICKPLDVYNEQLPQGAPRITIEPALVEALLAEARPGTLDRASRAAGDRSPEPDRSDDGIETPLLQMVLLRLWDEEIEAKSSSLRLATFERLGRAQGIAGSHLDHVMRRLGDGDADVAARVLRFLVTPSGGKIAHDTGALAAWSECPPADVQRVLTWLSSPETRVLRPVEAPGGPVRYEIFHDVLAPAVLDWRRRHTEQQTAKKVFEEAQAQRRKELEAERSQRLKRAVTVMSVVVVTILALTAIAVIQAMTARRAMRQAEAERVVAERNGTLAKQRMQRITEGLALKRAALSGDTRDLMAALGSQLAEKRIVFGARAIPLGYNNSSGDPVFRFELYPDSTSIPGGLKSVALITYKMDHPTFKNTLLATGPDRDFLASYNGWGCLTNVVAVIEYADPDKAPSIAVFDMCRLIQEQ